MCPELICVPYYFESYRTVSQKFYEILVSFTSEIEAVSCDEALLDVSNLVSEGRFAFTLLFVCFLHIAPNQILG